jgi:FkbH-like protein
MRGAMYRAETARKKLEATITDMETYYTSLEMVVEIKLVDEFATPRAAQLTQKTNQFNLTTKRYSEADIKELAGNNGSDVLYLRLSDKFGDSGIVGVCILKYKDGDCTFDSFLLSCRVLGRGVEDVFLIEALKLAKKRGCNKAFGEYYATKKNIQVEDFYAAKGMNEINNRATNASKAYIYDLRKDTPPEPKFFKKIISDIDDIKE